MADPAPAPRRRRRPARAQITDRDRTILLFCAENRLVLAGQIAILLSTSPGAAARRLRALRDAGYLNSEQTFFREPVPFSVTHAGLGAAGSDLRQPKGLNRAVYRHDVGVGWLMADAHRGVFGPLSEIVSERRMRSEDRRADVERPPHGVPLRGVGSALRAGLDRELHYPDLTVVTSSGQRVAFELELSRKGRSRRDRILAAYAADPRVDAVVYLVPTPADRDAIRASARRVGAEDRVHVQLFRWGGGRAPGSGQTRGAVRPSRLSSRRSPGRAGAQAVR